MNSHHPPYVELARQLETLILAGKLRSGEKLPPLRQLAEQYQLKNNAVQRALKVLRDKKLIHSIPGDGYYVAQAGSFTADHPMRLAVIQHVSSDFATVTYTSVALTGIQESAVRRGIELTIHYGVLLDNRNHQLDKLLLRAGNESDAIIALGTFDFQMASFSCRCPIVGISMHNSYRSKVSVISLDPFEAAELAADYFHSRNLRKVRVFTHMVDEHLIRLECFRRVWDGEIEVKPYSSLEPIQDADFPSEYPDDFGYFFTGGTLAEWHAKDFRAKYRTAMTESRAVLSIDGKSIFNPVQYEPMNTIVPDWALAGKLAVDEALRRVNDPGSGAIRQYLSVRFESARTTH